MEPSITTDWMANPVPVATSETSAGPAMVEVGAMDSSIGAGLLTVTSAVPIADGAGTLVALTVTVLGEGGTGGRV